MQSVVTTDSHLQHMETRICNLKNLCNYEKRIYLLFVISRFSVSTRANKWNKCKKFRQWWSELYKSSLYHLVITTTNASSRLLILLLYYIIFISYPYPGYLRDKMQYETENCRLYSKSTAFYYPHKSGQRRLTEGTWIIKKVRFL